MHIRALTWAMVASGAAALMYQTLWARAFAVLLGSTAEGAAVTFAAFLSGLALGAWGVGRVCARFKRPQVLYAILEGAIALLAIGSGLVLHHFSYDLGAFIGEQDGLAISVAFAIILPSTFLIGGTLPLILHIARMVGQNMGAVGRLYGWNTFGAALGTLFVGFVSIRYFGVTASYVLAGVLNVVAAWVVWPLIVPANRKIHNLEDIHYSVENTPPENVLLMLAGMSGFAFLAIEMVWMRFAGFMIGNRVYAFSLLLFTVLVAIAVAGWLTPLVVRRFRHMGTRLLIGLFLTAAVLTAVMADMAWLWITYQPQIEPNLPFIDTYFLLYRAVQALLFVLPGMIPLALVFPVVLTISDHAVADVAPATGRYYFLNTMGTVLGSLWVGLWAFEAMGTFATIEFLLIAMLLVCVALMAGLHVRRYKTTLVLFLVVGISVLAYTRNLPADLRLPHKGTMPVHYHEGREGVLQIYKTAEDTMPVFVNRLEVTSRLGLWETDYLQHLHAYMVMGHNPQAKHIMVLGNGHGITAGLFGRFAGVEQVDAVELLPALVDAAPLFAPHNFAFYENPKVQTHIADGRHMLTAQSKTYDGIVVTPSNPHVPTSAPLYTKEFMELVQQRLNPGGIYGTLVYGWEQDMIIQTARAVFPHVKVMPAISGAFVLIAANSPLTVDEQAFAAQIQQSPAVQQAATADGFGGDVLSLPRFIATAQNVSAYDSWLGPHVPVVTEDNAALEFSVPLYHRYDRILYSNE